MFPRFAKCFPLTVNAMETYWSTPVLAFYQFKMRWFASLALEQPEQNLFFDLGNSAYAVEGEEFERDHAMLPDAWKELYRWFWSFGITSDDQLSLYWTNTPFSFSSRLDLISYQKHFGGKRAAAIAFERNIGTDQLRCWLVTDAGDALWLDEQRCDKAIYHVHRGDYGNAFVLSDPGATLDRYMAHVIAGARPDDFDFRENGLRISRPTPT